ncbi:VWA domain-containing protein [Fodinicurvata fenggangensis]|uniref:VWA domain-containing protein n=1 Tax=Fodinicurvata fenggangensis TaxID=1121830 RepID=UPI001B80B222|nr:VWA domain-containing protein [Fodinicurvata fenggangensis]
MDLAGQLGIELPVDDSTDFTLTGKAQTQEYDDDGFAEDGAYRELIDGWQECNDCGDKTEWTAESSVSFKVEGVVAEAETGFGSYGEACAPIIVGGEAVSAGASEWPGTWAAYEQSWQDVDGISLSATGGDVVFRGPNTGPNDQVSAPGAFGVGVNGGSIDEVDGPEILRVDFDGPGAASVDVGLSMFYGGDIGTEKGTITVYGENDEVLGTIEISGEQDSYPNSAGLLDLSIGQKDLDTKGAIKALEFQAGEPGDNNSQSDLFLQSLSYEKAELAGWAFSEDGEKSSSEHGYKVDESSLVIPVKYSATAQDDDGSEGIFRIKLDKGDSEGSWTDAAGAALGDSVEIDGQTWGVEINEDGQLVLSYDEAENAQGDFDVAAPTSVDLSEVIGVKLDIDDSTDFTLQGKAWTREYDDNAFEDLGDRTLTGDWEEISADCADEEAKSGWDSIEIRVDGVAGAAKTWFAGDSEYQSLSGENDALRIPLNHVAKTQDDDGSEGITRLSLSLGAGLLGVTWLKDGQEVLADTSVELTDQKTDKEYTFNIKEVSGDQLVLELDGSDYPGPEKVDLADDGFKFEPPEGYSGDFTLNIDTTTTEFDDDAFDDLSERKLASDWQEICGDCGDKTATVSDKIGFQIEEPANTPPQADRVDTQALAVCEIDGAQADQLEGIINHLGSNYDVVAARPLTINDMIDGEDSGNDDVTLGGLDSESDLADLTFRITEAPDRGFLVVEDENGNYSIIDDSTDLTDDSNSTFSSTAKVWWLGEQDDVYEEGTETSTDPDKAPTLSGNTDTWELDGSGEVDLRGLKKDGSDWIESGLRHNNGIGLAVGDSAAAQVDDDERIEFDFNQAVNQAQFTLKPFNGVPEENGIAWTIFDEDGTKIDSGVDNPSDGPNGSTAIFDFQSDQPFHKIWIGPAEGDNGESAKFGIKDFSFVPVEKMPASFKYEVEDEGGLTSDPATVTIDPADGSCKIDLGTPDDGKVFEKGLGDGSDTDAALITDSGDLGVTNPSETSLSFSENQPAQIGLTSEGKPVTFDIAGNVLTGVADGEDVFTVTLNNDGTYSFDLHGNLDHDYGDDGRDDLDLMFNFKAEKDGSSQVGSFKVTVEDDVPAAENDDASASKGLKEPVNLTLVLDRSGSMEEHVNGTGKNRFEHMQSAAQSLISTFAAAGVALKLNVISFSYSADIEYDGSNIEEAKDAIANMAGPAGGTDFPDALEVAQKQIQADLNDPEFQDYLQKVYFLSDADDSYGSTDVGVPAEWKSFVEEHGLDVTGVGIDAGTDAQAALGELDSEGKEVLNVEDIENLEQELVATVDGEPVTGNLLGNDTAGADGIVVKGVKLSGSDDFVEMDDGTFTVQGNHGVLVVYGDGSYTYTPSNEASDGGQDLFIYEIIDGDGDTRTAELTVDIESADPVAYNNSAVVGQSTQTMTWDPIQEGQPFKANGGDAISFTWDADSELKGFSLKFSDAYLDIVGPNGSAEVPVTSSGVIGHPSSTIELPDLGTGDYTINAAQDNPGWGSFSIWDLEISREQLISNPLEGNVIYDPNYDPNDIENYGKQDIPSNDPDATEQNSWISKVDYEGDGEGSFDVPSGASDFLRIDSQLGDQNGYLKIWKNGDYEYVASSGLDQDSKEVFDYTLKTDNGEESAKLTIDVRKDGSIGQDDYVGGFKNVDDDRGLVYVNDDFGGEYKGDNNESNRIEAQDGKPLGDNDHLIGRGENDVLIGNNGDDLLEGHGGDDLLAGGKGDDDLYGNDGDDILNGGAGKNTMDGGDGKDTFVFDDEALADLLTNGDGNADSINNFDTGEDSIDLSALSDVLYDQENLIGNVHMDDDGNLTVDVRNEEGNKETVKVAEVTESGGGGVSDAQVYVDDNNSENIA